MFHISQSKLEFYVPIVLVVIVSLAAYLFAERYIRRKKLKRFHGREPLEEAEFYNLFYAQSGLPKALVVQALRDVASTLNLPQGKLRPSDALYDDLGPVKGFEYDDELNLLEDFVHGKLKKLGADADLGKMSTLDDLIRTLVTAEMRSSKSFE